MPAKTSPERRRRSRFPHKVRVILSGTSADGFNFAEETDTVSVSKHGASVRTSYQLRLGQDVSLRIKENNRVAQFLVVWLGEPSTPSEGKAGLEWVDPRRFWGIEFPPEDWEKD
jgi:PilZ domain-containing protein